MEVEKLSKSFGFSLPAHQNQGQLPFRKVSEELSTLPSGEYFVSWYKGSKRQMDPVGSNPEAALAALEKKRLLPAYIAVGGEIKTSNPPAAGNGTRKKVYGANKEHLDDCADREGKSDYAWRLVPRKPTSTASTSERVQAVSILR